jgi:endonuclease/exonuclease/phosphatase family metal-dependent hydrolase
MKTSNVEILRTINRRTGKLLLLTLILCMVVTQTGLGTSYAESQGSERTVTVMTRNMDEGSDLAPVLGASTPEELLAAVADTYTEVVDSDIPQRAAAVAREIRASKPDLVGLQEVSIWWTGPLGGPANNVTFDALQSLLLELRKLGMHYTAVAIQTNIDAEAPSALGFDVRLTDRDVLLARTDLMPSELRLSNVQAQQFETILEFTSPILGTLVIPQGWISVDAKIRGKQFRFITTHLDGFSPVVRLAQANELVQKPGNTDLPVVLIGDFNSDAESVDPDQNGAYQLLVGARFEDAWARVHPRKKAFTWPLHGEDPFTPFATPNQRIDLVFSRGAVRAVTTELIGNEREDLTRSHLWPSDHAGVVSSLQIR